MRIFSLINKKMNDDDFLNFYCSSADVVFNNGEDEVIFIKDKNFNFKYRSPAYLEQLAPDGSVGLDEKALTQTQQSSSDLAIQQDIEIKTSRQAKNFLYVDVYNRIGLIRKRPIINPSTNNVVGILGTVKPFSMPNILNLIHKMNNITHGIANKMQKIPLSLVLTERQQMVLFLYLNKYSNTEISDIITSISDKMSKSRVNDHLENLKYIFQVRSKEQLIEKAISLGYHVLIPRKFLKIGSYAFDDEIIISG